MPYGGRSRSGGIVVTDHKLSSLAGRRILKRGGNAADAAVASAAALSVIDPYMCGFAGFGYSLYYSAKEDRVYALDFIGTAPAAANVDLYTREKPWEDYKPSAEGILAGLVPGAISGWSTILEKFGSMKWNKVLEPALELARGFSVSPILHDFYEAVKAKAMFNPDTARIYYKNGYYPKPGRIFVQGDLARTMKVLAEKGAADFYRGTIAKRLVNCIKEAGGIIAEEDLAGYETKITTPVTGTYRGHRIFSVPPGSSGITILQWLNILEEFDLKSVKWNSDTFLHLFIEAGKLALRDDDRYNTGKHYIKVPVERLTSKEYASKQRSEIDPQHARFYELVSTPESYSGSTTHLCTCDAKGNIVSLTQTQMYGFDRVGILGDLGFNLNGGMCYFSLNPKHFERIEPGQKPRYVMSPTIVLNEGKAVTLGAAGGWTIPQSITETLVKMLDFDMEPQEAVDSPRWVMRYRYNSIPYARGTVVELENGIPIKTRRGLLQRGHKIYELRKDMASIAELMLNFGAVNALTYEKGVLSGGAESRRDGLAASF